MNLPGVWIDRMNTHKHLKKVVLDMDGSVSPTHGNQEQRLEQQNGNGSWSRNLEISGIHQ